jgi:DMSO/TMAO reductase YedYZ heme-binding membrane subunit
VAAALSAARPRRGRFEGPRLVAASALALAALCLALVASEGTDGPGLRALVRGTARFGLVCFLAAWVASSLRRLWPVPSTAWLLRNRRWIGLSFAVAQTAHAIALALLARRLGPAFETQPLSFAGGALGYAFTVALAATSSDHAVARLGARRWRQLHRAGVTWIWIVYAVTELPNALRSPVQFLLAALVVGAALLRLAARRAGRARRPDAAASGAMR